MNFPEILKWSTDNLAVIIVVFIILICAAFFYYWRKDKKNPSNDWEVPYDKTDLEGITHTINDNITMDVQESYKRGEKFELQCQEKIDHLNKKDVTINNLIALLQHKKQELQTARQLEQDRINMVQKTRAERNQQEQ